MDIKLKKDFADKIIAWYALYKRDLPWRDTDNPYFILLSEIILQQTRVEQGLPYYFNFITQYPSVQSLADAEESEVLRLWQGLGYYSRARNLHQTAKQIVQRFGGQIPESFSELLSLKGIGVYTASAIASFAFKLPYAVVDGNVYRVLARVFGIFDDISTGQAVKNFQQMANELLDKKDPSLYNQAIMEFGALQCTPKNPACNSCSLSNQCYANKNGLQSSLPVKTKKSVKLNRYFHYVVFKYKESYALNLRTGNDIWKGLYDFWLLEDKQALDPEQVIDRLSSIKVDKQLLLVSEKYKHQLTHQSLNVSFFVVEVSEQKLVTSATGANFKTKEEILSLPKPILISRFLDENIFV